MSTTQTIVMSVGGSLIVPDGIDTDFLRTLKTFITDQTNNHNRRFIMIAGGGRTARNYQDAAAAVTDLNPEDIDWMGIHATRLNGHLLRAVFRDIAHPEMITNPDTIQDIPGQPAVVIASGYRPGSSTDLIAVHIAQHVNATKIINLSNINYVYNDDPNTNPDAKIIETASWSEFRELIPDEWSPGMSAPFDPVAAKSAERSQMEVAVINGLKPEALANYLAGETFVGTLIK